MSDSRWVMFGSHQIILNTLDNDGFSFDLNVFTQNGPKLWNPKRAEFAWVDDFKLAKIELHFFFYFELSVNLLIGFVERYQNLINFNSNLSKWPILFLYDLIIWPWWPQKT